MTRDLPGSFVFTKAESGDERTVELSFSSETPYERWYGTEILDHKQDSVDLSRLSEIGTLLFNHNPNAPIGRIVSARIDEAGRRGVATVRFDEDELAERIFQKVKNGSLKGVSVGYRILNMESVKQGATSKDGRFKGPCEVAVRWEPLEISIVSVPADASVGVGRSDEEETGGIEMGEMKQQGLQAEEPQQRSVEPERPEQPKGGSGVPSPQPVDAGEESMRAVQEERTRVSEIMAMCRKYDLSPEGYVEKGTSVEEVRLAALRKLEEERKASQVTVQADEGDKFRAAAADGLAMRAGIVTEKPAEGAENFRGKSMLRLASECLEREGVSGTRDMQDEEIVRAAFTGSGAFPGILSNVAHKSMAQAYQAAPTTFQMWTAKGSNTDFKEVTRYRLSEADELVKMTEAGEFKHAEVTEASVKTVIATYGRSFSITRKAIIDDDMGALSRIPALYGQAARRMINKMAYKVLTDNPVIEGAALFHKDHNNLAAGSISIESLGKAKAMMARQMNIGKKEPLNIQPAYLIVPPELEVEAAQLISSTVDPTKANATPNPFANRLSVVCDPVLTNTEEWYLAAAPGLLPCVEITYLNGREQPTMESQVSFDTLGMRWRIYLDVGVNLIDYRGLLKSTGK